MKLSKDQLDRAMGALLGSAMGDALGAPYESGLRPLKPSEVPAMRGGGLGNYAPGEWTDDTQMATVVAAVAASGADLTTDAGRNAVAAGFLHWYRHGATDIGAQTRAVLGLTERILGRASEKQTERILGKVSENPGRIMTDGALDLHQRTGRSAGNGSLMRTAPVPLRYLDNPGACAVAAREVSRLTHFDPVAGDACVIWSELIRSAVMDGRPCDPLDAVRGYVPPARWQQWRGWLEDARNGQPQDFRNNGYVVSALQAAFAAARPVASRAWRDRPVTPDDAREALISAVRAGGDTDTVACIAGALVGSIAGGLALPADYREQVSGWAYKLGPDGEPGHAAGKAATLEDLAAEITRQ